jgi:hypothetical protein
MPCASPSTPASAASSSAFCPRFNRVSLSVISTGPMNTGQSKPSVLRVAIIVLVLFAYQPVWRAGFIWDDASI